MAWWNGLSQLQQIFAGIAIPATVIMIIQIVMFFIGAAEHGGDGDGDVTHPDFHVHNLHPADGSDYDGGMDHGDAYAVRLFTIRSIVALFAVGGWTGVVMDGLRLPAPASVSIALMAGWAALYFVTWSIRTALRLQSSGNLQLDNAIGKTGEVYITIPAAGKGTGKVNVTVQERFSEFDAATNADRDLKTGETVVVMGVRNDGALLVEPRDHVEAAQES